MQKTYLSTKNEVVDAELYAIRKALEIALQGGGTGSSSIRQREPPWTYIHIWANSQAVIKRLQHLDPDLGQWLARRIISRARQITEHQTVVEIHWVPGHIGVAGNEKANEAAKKAAESMGTQRCSEQFISLAHV